MKVLLTIFLLFMCGAVFGQITFNFIPEINGRNIDGLLSVQVINPFGSVKAQLALTVTERKAGTVIRLKTPAFTLLPGNSPLPGNAVSGSTVQFSQDKIGSIIARTRSLPQGDYEYCYELQVVGSDNPPLEQCFSYTLEPFADMSLIDPYNKDKICDKRPVLSWQPLLPAVPGASYQVILTEVKEGQSPTEALNYNLPLINQQNVISPILLYPPVVPGLVNKKKYAWQVTAYKDQAILVRSDIWEFTVDCKDSVKKADSTLMSYRDVEDLSAGNHYVALGELRFRITNPYQEKKMEYTIYPAENRSRMIKGLEVITLKTGDNYIILDLNENGRFKDGKYYIMEIRLPNGSLRSLRFLYEQTKN